MPNKKEKKKNKMLTDFYTTFQISHLQDYFIPTFITHDSKVRCVIIQKSLESIQQLITRCSKKKEGNVKQKFWLKM